MLLKSHFSTFAFFCRFVVVSTCAPMLKLTHFFDYVGEQRSEFRAAGGRDEGGRWRHPTDGLPAR